MMKRIMVIFLCTATLLLHCSVVSIATQSPFSDVKPTHWAYSAINEMVSEGILSGFSDGTFRPSEPITRAQFAKILTLSLKLDNNGTKPLVIADLKQSDWYYPYMRACLPYLVFFNSDDGILCLGNTQMLREDVAHSIVCAKNLQDSIPISIFLDKYQDKNQITDAYLNDVNIAVQNNLMQGNSTLFNPLGSLTRAEACMLIYKNNLLNTPAEKVDLDAFITNYVEVPITPPASTKDTPEDIQYGGSPDFSVTETENGNLEFNDGYIAFQYPKGYEMINDDMGAAYSAWKQGSYMTVYYDDQIGNITLTSTTLTDIYNALLTTYGTSLNNEIDVYDNAIVLVSEVNGSNNYDIYIEGIGLYVPHIRLTNTGCSYDEHKAISETIINTFTTTVKTGPVSNGAISVQMEKVFNDGNIRFSYPHALKLEESTTVTARGYQNYSGTLNGVTVKIQYIEWNESGTYLDQLGSYLSAFYSNQDPIQYQGGWVSNTFTVYHLGDGTAPYEEQIYGRGIDNILPVITITGSTPSSLMYSGTLESDTYSEIRDKITNSLEVISDIPPTS